MTGAAFIWWLSPVFAQFLGEHLKKERLGCVQEEVVARKHPQREGGTRLITPGFQIVTNHPVVLQAAKAGDAAVERRFGRVHVRFENSEIRPQQGQHYLHDLRIFQHLSRSAIQATQFFQELHLGQGMDRPVSRRNLRRASRRDKQANRLNTRLSPKLTGEFKADQSAQAVTEEGERLVQEWSQGLGEGLDKRREPSERSLHQPGSPTWQLNRADLDISGQVVRPGTKNRGPGSCVREAEQTEAGLRVRSAAGNPGVKGGSGGQ